MSIDRFVTLRADASTLRCAALLAAALAWVGAAQAQIPNQQRLLPTPTAATLGNAASAALATESATTAVSGTSDESASSTSTHHGATHHTYRKHVVRHRTHTVHAAHTYVAAPAAEPQIHAVYQGTTVTHPADAAAGAATMAAAPAPAPVAAPVAAPAPERHYRASEIGHSTSALLDLQASNREAGSDAPMLGAAATAAYQRYIDSFKHPIPETFASKLSGSGGGGGSQ